jgi:hypothetical protein
MTGAPTTTAEASDLSCGFTLQGGPAQMMIYSDSTIQGSWNKLLDKIYGHYYEEGA